MKRATESQTGSASDASVDRALEAASRKIDRTTRRRFHPYTDTRSFDWPGQQPHLPWRLWADGDLLSVTELTVAGDVVSAADYNLEPQRFGPPYNRIEADLSSSFAFGSDETPQRAISVEGVWGYCDDREAAGALAAALTDTTSTTVTVTDSSLAGVGDLLTVGSERMEVSGSGLADTSADLAADLSALESARTVSVDDGTKVHAGETVAVGSERMLVESVAGNSLSVRRAYDGSVLAAHSMGDSLYAPRALTVTRGAQGSTAATHLVSTAVERNVPPAPISEWCVAEAIDQIQQERSAYSRTSGTGDNMREATGGALAKLARETASLYSRKVGPATC